MPESLAATALTLTMLERGAVLPPLYDWLARSHALREMLCQEAADEGVSPAGIKQAAVMQADLLASAVLPCVPTSQRPAWDAALRHFRQAADVAELAAAHRNADGEAVRATTLDRLAHLSAMADGAGHGEGNERRPHLRGVAKPEADDDSAKSSVRIRARPYRTLSALLVLAIVAVWAGFRVFLDGQSPLVTASPASPPLKRTQGIH